MSGTPNGGPEPKNGSPMAALFELAKGGNQYVQLGTVLVVLLSGAGNFLTTYQSGRETQRMSREDREDVLKAISEIHDVHKVLDATIERQKDIQRTTNTILDKVSQQKTINQ